MSLVLLAALAVSPNARAAPASFYEAHVEQAGTSGGPLLDGSGNLVGVLSAKHDAVKMALASGDLQNVYFAVKSEVVATFLNANRVTYKTGSPNAVSKRTVDIA